MNKFLTNLEQTFSDDEKAVIKNKLENILGTDQVKMAWIPTVADNGLISWTLASYTTQPPKTMNIKGPQGEPGENGKNGADGTSVTITNVEEEGRTHVVKFSDGKSITITDGVDGTTGKDGYTPSATTATVTGEGHPNSGTEITFSWPADVTWKNPITITAWNGNDGKAGDLPAAPTAVGKYVLNKPADGDAAWVDYEADAYTLTGEKGITVTAGTGNETVIKLDDDIYENVTNPLNITGDGKFVSVTESGDNLVIGFTMTDVTGTDQYALTTAGWAKVQGGGGTEGLTSVSADATYFSGDGTADTPLGLTTAFTADLMYNSYIKTNNHGQVGFTDAAGSLIGLQYNSANSAYESVNIPGALSFYQGNISHNATAEFAGATMCGGGWRKLVFRTGSATQYTTDYDPNMINLMEYIPMKVVTDASLTAEGQLTIVIE